MNVVRERGKIRRLLIANRGEISRRIIRCADRMRIATVAVYSDVDANALHVREATIAHALGGAASVDSYLRIDKLIAAARATDSDAVHPGYGFLSENADFAQAVLDAGLLWVGPPPDAIRKLGSKSSARRLAQSLGVPCLPGYEGEDQSDSRFAGEAGRIGFPLMVKAASGGGGRGMRIVTATNELAAALHSARSEAQAAFGSGELLLERALLHARHVEMQVLADAHGHCIHLGERDCSVQRRHQKIIEETPSPAVDSVLRERMGRCATGLARAAGYVGAGTVEFLLEGASTTSGLEGFYLMEMNTRLQVEHPVTEAVTGLDLVEWQIRVAQGEALPLTQEQVRFSGHSIEVRLCAEDEEFTPQTGRVRRFAPPAGIRFDHAIGEGLQVSPHYDSMLGKLIAHAPTRDEAIDQLLGALRRLQILGLPTNRAFLAACLDHPEFRAGAALIPFLAQEGKAIRAALRAQEKEVAVGAALAAIYSPLSAGASPQRRLACPFPRPLRLRVGGELLRVSVRETSDGSIDVESADGGRSTRRPQAICVALGEGRWHVQCGSADFLVEDASFEAPGAGGGAATDLELRAPFNGKVIAVKVVAGQAVEPGDPLLVIESMKLEHALAASRAGVVESVRVEPGQQAATGQVLITFQAAP